MARRNQIHLPPLSDNICTIEFITDARKNLIWIPKTPEVTSAFCAEQPT